MNWRVLAAVALVVSAAVHLKLWFGGVRDQSVGPAFLVNVVAGVVIAVLLLRWREHWLPAFLTLGFGLSTLGAFIISTTVGLMGVHAHWEGFYVFAAAIAEVVCIAVGAMLLLEARTHRSVVAQRTV
jgi:predicted tellurium resistance membrane protein TerC